MIPIAQAAQQIGCTLRTAQRAATRAKLARRVGRCLFVWPLDLDLLAKAIHKGPGNPKTGDSAWQSARARQSHVARRFRRTAFGAALERAAEENGLGVAELKTAALEVWDSNRDFLAQREREKAYARKYCGLTAAKLARLENDGKDVASLGFSFGRLARELARECPTLGLGNADDGSIDFGARLWDAIREGKRPLPRRHDAAILRQAVELVQSGRAAQAEAVEDDSFDVANFAA